MSDIEKGISFPGEFQPIPKYKEFARSPFIVTGKTYALLRLFHAKALPDFTHGRDYLKQYTLNYLDTAKSTCGKIFDKEGILKENTDLESREIASHAYVIFSWLPDMTTIPSVSALKDGFSRNGMLKAPLTQKEFEARIRELKIELAKIATGITEPEQIYRPKLPLFRTFVFFRVAAHLNPSFKLKPGEKESLEQQEEERQKINKLLIDSSSIDEI